MRAPSALEGVVKNSGTSTAYLADGTDFISSLQWDLCPGFDPALGTPLCRDKRNSLSCSTALMFIKGSVFMLSEASHQTLLPRLDKS